MTSTLTTLTSQLNTLLEQQASIIRDAQAFAESLELSSNMKELKQIASEWNVIPDNKTKKASYIAALHQAYAEKNGLAEVNEHIEKLQFQIKCAEAQECANAQQKVIRVIRTIENEWWVGTEETFNAIYPNEGYEIHFTARPEKPDTYSLTSNPAILMQDVKINGTTYTVYGHDREELEQETLVLTEAVQQAQQETLYDRLHKGESINVKTAQGVHFTVQPAYWEGNILGYTVIQNGSIVPGYNGMMLDTANDWLAELEEDVTDHAEPPLQGVASFLEALAIFSAHDVLPFDVVGDVELYHELKSKWDDMDGDEKCQCDWCDAEPLQEQEQEELQFMEKQEKEPEILESSSLTQDSNSAKMTVWKDGEIWIESGGRTIYFSAREAYALLAALYDNRDILHKSAQQEWQKKEQQEEQPQGEQRIPDWPVILFPRFHQSLSFPLWGYMNDQDKHKHPLQGIERTKDMGHNEERRQYAEKHLSEHLAESRKGVLLGTGLLSWPREERISGRYGLVALFDEDWDQSPWQVDITSLAGKYGSLVAVLDGEEIELGKGICLTEQYYDNDYIGLRPPLDYLEEEWLSPSQLRKVDGRVINKPVELWFVEQ